MASSTLALTNLSPAHLDGATALSREAAWPHRREDWAFMLALSRGFAAVEDGELVGTALMTPYGADAATINMVIVSARMRGRGLGRRLMDAALDSAGARECRLVATLEGLPLYEKLGFRAVGEIAQHQGVLADRLPPAPAAVTWASPDEIDALIALDRAACGMDRTQLLHALAAIGEVAVLRGADGPRGFAVLRPFGRGDVAGPVVAPSRTEAEQLIAFLMATRPGRFLRVDTPDVEGIGAFLAHHGLARVGGGTPMIRNARSAAPVDGARTFALASQALG